jgi:hypothetical protein
MIWPRCQPHRRRNQRPRRNWWSRRSARTGGDGRGRSCSRSQPTTGTRLSSTSTCYSSRGQPGMKDAEKAQRRCCQLATLFFLVSGTFSSWKMIWQICLMVFCPLCSCSNEFLPSQSTYTIVCFAGLPLERLGKYA